MPARLHDNWIRRPYGTHRGLIRLLFDQAKWRAGRYRACENIDWTRIERLVFVCQGNICRSPYAHVLAEQDGLPVASFGYATTTGLPANEVAKTVARVRGHSLDGHVTTDVGDFTITADDLLLVMEDRHLPKVAPRAQAVGAQVTLLGLWAEPPRPLIYDPNHLSEAYFHTCYGVIESAVAKVAERWRTAHAAASSPQ